MTAVFTPMTSPALVTSGPPELPGFSEASVWMMSSISRPVARAATARARYDSGRNCLEATDADRDH